MKLTKRQLRKIIRESFDHLETSDPRVKKLRMKLLPILAEAYIDQDMSYDDIMLAVNWAVSYMGDFEWIEQNPNRLQVNQMRLTKNRIKRIIKEAIQNPSTPLEQELSKDESVDKIRAGEYVMYCDHTNGQQELEYIIERLRTIYAMGGGVGEIAIYDIGGGLVRESSYDYSKTYEPLDYEYVFTIINDMYDDHYPDEIAAHLADEVDQKDIEAALEEALEDQMHPQDPTVKILKMAVHYVGRGRFSR